MNENKIISVCLVGAGGRIGCLHLKNLLAAPFVHVRVLVDEDEDAARQALTRAAGVSASHGIQFAKSLEEGLSLLPDGALDAVCICTPTASHAALTRQALLAGLNVFCEKPLAMSVAEIDGLYELAVQRGVRLLTGYQRRFDSSFQRVCEGARSGQIGDVVLVKSTSRDSPVPSLAYLAISGGMYHDCGSHDFDLVAWAAGERPLQVSAVGTAVLPEIGALNDVDNCVVTMQFAGSKLAVVDLSRRGAAGYDQRLECLGTDGMLACNNQLADEAVLHNDQGLLSAKLKYSFPQRYVEAYNTEMLHFMDSIRNPSVVLRVQHADAVTSTAIACAAHESWLAGGAFVRVDYGKTSDSPPLDTATPPKKKTKK